MASAIRNPYKLSHMFLINLSFKRDVTMEDPTELPIKSEVKVIEPGFPKLQINMRISSPPENKLSFELEAVAVFNYAGENTEYDKELNKQFVSEVGLQMIWVYVTQIVSMITSQMGMSPIRINIPVVPIELDKIQEKQIKSPSQ